MLSCHVGRDVSVKTTVGPRGEIRAEVKERDALEQTPLMLAMQLLAAQPPLGPRRHPRTTRT